MTHLHNQKKAFKHIPYNFLNHGTCPQQTQVLSRRGYILVNIAQITVDIWQLQDQTQLLANVPNLMWTSGPECPGRGVFVGVFLNACTESPTLKGSISWY